MRMIFLISKVEETFTCHFDPWSWPKSLDSLSEAVENFLAGKQKWHALAWTKAVLSASFWRQRNNRDRPEGRSNALSYPLQSYVSSDLSIMSSQNRVCTTHRGVYLTDNFQVLLVNDYPCRQRTIFITTSEGIWILSSALWLKGWQRVGQIYGSDYTWSLVWLSYIFFH